MWTWSDAPAHVLKVWLHVRPPWFLGTNTSTAVACSHAVRPAKFRLPRLLATKAMLFSQRCRWLLHCRLPLLLSGGSGPTIRQKTDCMQSTKAFQPDSWLVGPPAQASPDCLLWCTGGTQSWHLLRSCPSQEGPESATTAAAARCARSAAGCG